MDHVVPETATEIFNKEYNLKKTELFKFYIEFNKDCSNNDYECKDINIPASLNNNNNNNIYLRNLYRKYIRNIKNIKNGNFSKIKNIDNGQNVEQLCIYLKYWIYDIIANNVRSDSDISTFFNTWNSEKNSLFSDNKCPCEIYKMDLKEINEIRKLYDYYMLYDTFEETKSINDKNYITEYCSYLKQFKEIYDNKETSCALSDSNNYCKEFNKYIKTNVNDTAFSSIDEYCKVKIVDDSIVVQSESLNQSHYKEASKKYGIFQVLEQYHKDKEKLIKDADDNNSNNICDIKCSSDKCTINVKEICEKFAKIFLSLYKPNMTEKIFRTGYAKILNYLFNEELRVIKSESDRNEYYKKFKINCTNDGRLNELKDHISYIDDDEYKKLNILYQLYDKFRKIVTKPTECIEIEKKKSPECDENCVNTYNEGITLYKDKNDKDFYYALNEFSVLYNKHIYRKNLNDTNKLKALPYFHSVDDSKEGDVQNVISLCKKIQDQIISSSPQKNTHEISLINSTMNNIYNKLSKLTLDENICAKYCNEIISLDENNNEKIKALCATLATNLKKLNTLDGVGDNYKDKCSNLKYWTYDQIFGLFSTGNNYIDNSLIINKINQVIFRVNEELDVDKKCTFYVDDSSKDWDKERDLHYYFSKFDTLSMVKDDDDENKKQCTYLKYINGIYNEHIKKCCTRYIRPNKYMENKCPSYFKCEEKYYPIDLMTKLKCEHNEHKESVEDIFDSITVDLNVIKYSIFMNSFNQIVNITNDPFYLFVLAAFGLLGFFFIFFIFYKFTPLGSSNRKRISRRNMDMRETSNYPRQESISYNKKSTNANPQRKRVQIAYQVT